jgi:hypothetical protein
MYWTGNQQGKTTMQTIATTTTPTILQKRADLESALNLPGAPFVRIITRTLKSPTTKAYKHLGGNGCCATHRATGQAFGDLYPKGIVLTRSIVIRAGRSYERDVVNQRVAESEIEGSRWHGMSADAIRAEGYESEGLFKGHAQSVGKHLAQHKTKQNADKTGRQVYFVYSPDQTRDSAEMRKENWSRYTDKATGRTLEDWEVQDVKLNFLSADTKTNKQGVQFDRARRTVKIENLLQVKAGDTYQVDGAQFRI